MDMLIDEKNLKRLNRSLIRVCDAHFYHAADKDAALNSIIVCLSEGLAAAISARAGADARLADEFVMVAEKSIRETAMEFCQRLGR